MTTRYVGTGGNDANSGLTWALRKLTLNGVEDTPVAAGDTVYVGAGVYREMLTCDVSGSGGSPISYIGDYDGSHTDGTGGVIRISGSDNDTSNNRNSAINCTCNYRTFNGFLIEYISGANAAIFIYGSTNFIIEKCMIFYHGSGYSVWGYDAGQSAITVRNCIFYGNSKIGFTHSSDLNNAGHSIENCILIANHGTSAVTITNVGGIAIKNCLFSGGFAGVHLTDNPAAGQTITVNNSIFINNYLGLYNVGSFAGFTENYNCFYGNVADRINVGVGANSNVYNPLMDGRWFFELLAGGSILSPFDLASYSQLINVAGTSPTSTDMRGTGTIGAEREWGALEYDSTLDIEAGSGGGAVSISPCNGKVGL